MNKENKTPTDDYHENLKEFYDNDYWIKEFLELERNGVKIFNLRRYLSYKSRLYLSLFITFILYYLAGLYVGYFIF